jgi:hypothetical protein
MLNFQTLLVHIIGLIIWCCLKNQIQVVYIFFIFKFLEENKLKMFRLKLFHFIIPNKILLFKWKIVGNSLCNFCKLNVCLSKRVLDKISEFNKGFGYRNQNYFETYSTWI